ncbi:hypothetical protein B7P43_G02594, partial [Cryptotermes secundus]
NPAKREVRAVIRFLHAKGETAAEIHLQLVSVYGRDLMNRQNVAKWCREFEGGRNDVHDEIKSGRPSVVTDEVIQKTDENIRADRRRTIDELHQQCLINSFDPIRLYIVIVIIIIIITIIIIIIIIISNLSDDRLLPMYVIGLELNISRLPDDEICVSKFSEDVAGVVPHSTPSQLTCLEVPAGYAIVQFSECSHGMAYLIIHDRLGFHKVCARWVPRMVTPQHKMQRMGLALQLPNIHALSGIRTHDPSVRASGFRPRGYCYLFIVYST